MATTSGSTPGAAVDDRRRRSTALVLLSGASVGLLGGLVGLGGAEFRLPLLIGLFGLAALTAVVVNKALSLVVVLAALPARSWGVPPAEVLAAWPVVAGLLPGTLLGAWVGAGWATRASTAALHRVLAALLLVMAVALLLTHLGEVRPLDLAPPTRAAAGLAAGVGIGAVAAVMGVAGGELLIPTIVLLHGADAALAGSLSLVVSLPTMLVAFGRYGRDGALVVLREHRRFLVTMAVGSVAGVLAGAALLGVVPDRVLVPLLAAVLVVSAARLRRHGASARDTRGTGSSTQA